MDIQPSPANDGLPTVDQAIVSRTSGLATTSLVLGILGFLTFGLTGIVAIILSHLALSQIRKAEGRLTGKGIAIAGLVTGCFSILILVGLVVAFFNLPVGCSLPKTKQLDADFRSFESALAMYKLNAGAYPTTEQGLEALVEKPTVAPLPRRWACVMSKLNPDTWGNAYQYRFPSHDNPPKPELFSKGPDGIAGTKDDLINGIP